MNSNIATASRPAVGRLLPLLAFVGFGLLATLLPLAAAADDQSGELHPVVQHMVDAWAAGDGAAFAEPFATDALFLAPNGQPIEGRAAIAASHQRLFDTAYQHTTISARQEVYRRLADDLALVRVLGRSSANSDDPGTRMILILRSDREKWQIVSAQLTPILLQ